MKVVQSKVQWGRYEITDSEGRRVVRFARIGQCITFACGTVARFNYKHGTWSVQSPYGDGKRITGMELCRFKREYPASFVSMCQTACVKGY